MFELFELIPPWVRLLLASAAIASGLFECFTGYRAFEELDKEQHRSHNAADPYAMRGAKSEFEIGIVATLIGTGIFAMSGRSRSQKNGYRSC